MEKYSKMFDQKYVSSEDAAFSPNGERSEYAMGCYKSTFTPSYGVWEFAASLSFSFPLFLMQIVLTLSILRFILFVIRPLRMPRVVAEILCGVVLGPSLLGQFHGRSKEEFDSYGRTSADPGFSETWGFLKLFFPAHSITSLESAANLGLLYYLFMVGVEIDLSIITRIGKKAITIAATCIGVAMVIALGVSSIEITMGDEAELEPTNEVKQKHVLGQFVVLGVSFSITAFPVVARILSENNLLNTELGRTTMSSALIVDISSWILLAFAVPLTDNRLPLISGKQAQTQEDNIPMYVAVSTLVFVLFCVFLLRPAVKWVIKRKSDDENLSPIVTMLLVGVMGCASVSDLIGVHAIFGALIFGLIIPHGPVAVAVIEGLEDFVTELFLPLYFVVSGLRTDFSKLSMQDEYCLKLFGIVMGNFALKIVAVSVVSMFKGMHISDGLTVGFLMNTKGIVQVLILNIARDQLVLDQKSFSVMIFATVLMTGTISSAVAFIFKAARGFITYKHRTIQQLSKGGIELRVLACVHNTRQVQGIISLLEISQCTPDSYMGVFGLHLVELTGRASAMLIVHNTGKASQGVSTGAPSHYEHFINSFKSYEQRSNAVYVQTLTAISPYNSIHEDICNMAEEKFASIIILPFHKHQTVDGDMETTNAAYQSINQNVLGNAPCSVGILVDRGINNTNQRSTFAHSIVMLFFGGPDDREALVYARRMAGRPDISLTVLRFLPGMQVLQQTSTNNESYDHTRLTVDTNFEKQKQADDEFIRKFRMRTTDDESIVYSEKLVNSVTDTVEVIRAIGNVHDLYIVGKGPGTVEDLTAGLVEWCECPELGGIGDLLASSDFKHASVLVVQQYAGAQILGEGFSSSPGSQQSSDRLYNI